MKDKAKPQYMGLSFLFKNNKMGYRLVKNRKELINTGKVGIVILRNGGNTLDKH